MVSREVSCLFDMWRTTVEEQMEQFHDRKSKRAKWMESKLSPVYQRFIPTDPYWQFVCQTIHFQYYEATAICLSPQEYQELIQNFPYARTILSPYVRITDTLVWVDIKAIPEQQKKKLGKAFEAIKEKDKREDIRSAYKGLVDAHLNRPAPMLELMQQLGFPVDQHLPVQDLKNLPPYSFFLQFQFELEKPYLSKDDTDFYIIDNPIKKEKVFKVPYISASSWKGNLRSVMTRQIVEWWEKEETDKTTEYSIQQFARRRARVTVLFGNENEAYTAYLDELAPDAATAYHDMLRKKAGKDELLSGRLYFYPTFFNRISLEVINPHSRKTKAGTTPILMETVPTGTQGLFALLYVPFDLIGQPEQVNKAAAKDLNMLPRALQDLMTIYGFSAKRTSGFGVIKDMSNDEAEGLIPEEHMSENMKELKRIRGQILQAQPPEIKEFTSFTGMRTVINQIVQTLNKTAHDAPSDMQE